MVRYAKKNQFEALRDSKLHRAPRKTRGHKFNGGSNKQERHYGWGYAKRRHVLLSEE